MSAGVIHVRNPGRLYAIAFAEPAWDNALGYLACHPVMDGAAPEEIALEIVADGPWIELREPGCAARPFAAINEVRDHLHARFFRESLAGSQPLLHAACLLYQGRRVLLVGPKNAGKSTLTLALALAGFAIEGDENVFVGQNGVTARPRACRVKESSFTVLPALCRLARQAAFMTDYHGRRIYNLSPDLLGQPWRIGTGKADAIILVHANHGGMSSIRPVPPLGLTRELMAEMAFPATARAAGIAAVTRMVAGAAGYDLSSGDLPAAVDCIKFILQN